MVGPLLPALPLALALSNPHVKSRANCRRLLSLHQMAPVEQLSCLGIFGAIFGRPRSIILSHKTHGYLDLISVWDFRGGEENRKETELKII